MSARTAIGRRAPAKVANTRRIVPTQVKVGARSEPIMSLRKVKLSDLKSFAYSLGGNIQAKRADVGRTVGSKTIGLTIQTVGRGCFSPRRHKHVFQEEILIVMSGE